MFFLSCLTCQQESMWKTWGIGGGTGMALGEVGATNLMDLFLCENKISWEIFPCLFVFSFHFHHLYLSFGNMFTWRD